MMFKTKLNPKNTYSCGNVIEPFALLEIFFQYIALKLFKLDEPDMQDTAGEAEMNS